MDWGALLSAAVKAYGGGGGGGGGTATGGGGWYQKYGPLITAGISAAGAIGKGKQKGREAESAAAERGAAFKQDDAAFAERALENRAALDLQQRSFAQESERNAYRDALRSALGINYTPVSVNRPEGISTIKFNLGPGFGSHGKAASEAMFEKALNRLMKGEQFDALPPIERSSLPAFKGPGKVENLLGAIGVGGSALVNAQQQTRQQQLLDAIIRAQGGGIRTPESPGIFGPGMEDPDGGLSGDAASLAAIRKRLEEERDNPTGDQDSIWG